MAVKPGYAQTQRTTHYQPEHATHGSRHYSSLVFGLCLNWTSHRGGSDPKSRNLRSEISRYFNKYRLQGGRQDEISLGLVIWVR